ncbi:MAG: tetratricopeptide repeat protein [Planctomycetota bacterium]|jgi:tetratricopeptide (TPR) repeat protein
MRRVLTMMAMALGVLALWGGCTAPERKPKDLETLHRHLLVKAKQKYKHALRITKQHAPDPFNQAREQLVFTMIELKEFNKAAETAEGFIQQKVEYLELARARLAEIELEWKKELLGNPKLEGTKRETSYLELRDEWQNRIRLAEYQMVSLTLLRGEVLLRTERYADAVPVFKQILTVRPDHNTALRRIGQAYALLRKYGLAATFMEKAYCCLEKKIQKIREEQLLEANPEKGEPEPGGSRIQTAAQERIKAMEAALIEIAAMAGLLQFLGGELSQSQIWFGRAFALDPTSRYLELKLALTLIQEKRVEKAKPHLQNFKKDLGDDPASLVLTLLTHVEEKYGLKSPE